jgi:hypothetical protein
MRAERELGKLLKSVDGHLAKRKTRAADVRAFAAVFYSHGVTEDLLRYGAGDLAALAEAAFRFAGPRSSRCPTTTCRSSSIPPSPC